MQGHELEIEPAWIVPGRFRTSVSRQATHLVLPFLNRKLSTVFSSLVLPSRDLGVFTGFHFFLQF